MGSYLNQVVVDFKSRGNSVIIVSDYKLDVWGLIPDRGRGFFFWPLRPARLGGPPRLLSKGYRGGGGPSPGGKEQSGRDADHSSSAKVKNE
jgi:hypothetical protein